MIKEDMANRLYCVMLNFAGKKPNYYSGGDLLRLLREFVKVNKVPVSDFNYD